VSVRIPPREGVNVERVRLGLDRSETGKLDISFLGTFLIIKRNAGRRIALLWGMAFGIIK